MVLEQSIRNEHLSQLVKVRGPMRTDQAWQVAPPRQFPVPGNSQVLMPFVPWISKSELILLELIFVSQAGYVIRRMSHYSLQRQPIHSSSHRKQSAGWSGLADKRMSQTGKYVHGRRLGCHFPLRGCTTRFGSIKMRLKWR